MVALSPSSADFVLLASTLVRELAVIDDELGKDRRTSPEDQLKTPIHNFLMSAADLMMRKIRVVTEHRQTAADDIQGVRLDMAIKRTTGPLIGHVELKSSLKGANPYKVQGWSKHDKAQWRKLKNHSNLKTPCFTFAKGYNSTNLRSEISCCTRRTPHHFTQSDAVFNFSFSMNDLPQTRT